MALMVRLATLGDAPILAAHNQALARETEELQLDSRRVGLGVQAVLRDPAKGYYLVAVRDEAVIGQLLITYEWSDWRNGVFWWIQSVYVAPEARRQGVYKLLYQDVVDRAQTQGDVCGIRLYVEKQNERARTAYKSLGMQPTVYEMYETDFVIER